MEDKQLQKKEFIREKIKNKPLNKKRIFGKLAISALCGLVFALVVCIVLAIALPHIIDEHKKAKEEISDHNSEAVGLNTQMIELPQAPTAEDVPLEFSLDDYQNIQNQLYAIGNQVNKSIVTVTGVTSDTDIFMNSYETEGLQAGVIIKDTGNEFLILTERKGIVDASRIHVTFIDESVAEATLKKYDGNTGLAILSVDKRKLESGTVSAVKVAQFGSSNSVSKGSLIIAVGSPLGTSYSILTGNITSTNNEISTEDHNYTIFTTDIVASENGSGILVDVQGAVIGMVMQDYSTSESGNTLTAIAISELSSTINMMSNGQDIPYIGLHVSTVTDKISTTYDIPKGVYIRTVTMDSPAMGAGLQSGDVIVSINGETISTTTTYEAKVLTLIPGEKVSVEVKRQNAAGYSDVTVTVPVGVLQ